MRTEYPSSLSLLFVNENPISIISAALYIVRHLNIHASADEAIRYTNFCRLYLKIGRKRLRKAARELFAQFVETIVHSFQVQIFFEVSNNL